MISYNKFLCRRKRKNPEACGPRGLSVGLSNVCKIPRSHVWGVITVAGIIKRLLSFLALSLSSSSVKLASMFTTVSEVLRLVKVRTGLRDISFNSQSSFNGFDHQSELGSREQPI